MLKLKSVKTQSWEIPPKLRAYGIGTGYHDYVNNEIGIDTSSKYNYLMFLHELGHCKSGHNKKVTSKLWVESRAYYRPVRAEAEAWRWAVKKLARPLREDEKVMIRLCYQTYTEHNKKVVVPKPTIHKISRLKLEKYLLPKNFIPWDAWD